MTSQELGRSFVAAGLI